jgi:CheY-like chemotaxis protein
MGKKILVIDDDPNIIEYLQTLLEDNGYSVVSASDGAQGLVQAERELPDLITLDIEMPGDWGPKVFRDLSSRNELKNIPVVVISGLPDNQHAILKAAASLTKPFDRDELLEIISGILD